jgi:hypothetical protein
VELRRSLQNPHPESAELAEQGLEEWTRGLPEEDAEALVDRGSGLAANFMGRTRHRSSNRRLRRAS